MKTKMKKYLTLENILLIGWLAMAICTPCYADFESSLVGLKTKLTGVVLPVLSVMGMAFAGMSFFTGNPNAKQHVMYAIFGSVIGFGAQAIVDLISQTVR